MKNIDPILDRSVRERPGMARLEEIQSHRGTLVAVGVLLIVLGVISCLLSLFATLITVMIVAGLLFFAGLFHGVQAFSSRKWSGVFLHLLGSVLFVVTGAVIALRPLAGALSLTLILASYFLVSGAFRALGSLFTRFPGWGWLFFSGVVNFVLGLFILGQWPISAVWVIGTFVGLDLIFYGWSLMMLSAAIAEFPRPEVERPRKIA